eukprot:8539895-Pyramimonas_sp.AAC.1
MAEKKLTRPLRGGWVVRCSSPPEMFLVRRFARSALATHTLQEGTRVNLPYKHYPHILARADRAKLARFPRPIA